MSLKKVSEKKFKLLKLELNILNTRINHISENVWKIRQIGLTLWLASLSVGLGAVSYKNIPVFDILFLSTFIPFLFLFIDAGQIRWYHRYESRESEIRKFINSEDYILPSTKEKLSFEKNINNEIIEFPIYDLTGIITFGEDELYLWRTSKLYSLLTLTPLIFWGLQILISILFSSLEFSKNKQEFIWWVPPLLVLLLIGGLYLFAKLRKKKFLKKKNSTL